jgi:hypothetical protein
VVVERGMHMMLAWQAALQDPMGRYDAME